MEYFILGQDLRYTNAVEPKDDLGLFRRIPFQIDQELASPPMDDEPVQLYIKENQDPRYLDFIERPAVLVSDRLKQILAKYEPRLFFKPVILADRKRLHQAVYWWMRLSPTDCLSENSLFNKNGTIKQLVLDRNKAAGLKVFRVAGLMEEYVLVRLDVAESLLRRDFCGIQFKRVAVA
ncbi:MAG: serine protease [Firmicutes bacterium]|nr:serine protease [Bacillota bacterium]